MEVWSGWGMRDAIAPSCERWPLSSHSNAFPNMQHSTQQAEKRAVWPLNGVCCDFSQHPACKSPFLLQTAGSDSARSCCRGVFHSIFRNLFYGNKEHIWGTWLDHLPSNYHGDSESQTGRGQSKKIRKSHPLQISRHKSQIPQVGRCSVQVHMLSIKHKYMTNWQYFKYGYIPCMLLL